MTFLLMPHHGLTPFASTPLICADITTKRESCEAAA
jgi:hypothetical protein